jgi:hypothetical protein
MTSPHTRFSRPRIDAAADEYQWLGAACGRCTPPPETNIDPTGLSVWHTS